MLVASVHHQPSSVLLNFETLSSNSFDKSVDDKPQNVCWKVSVVFTSRITFSFNLVPLYTTVSKNNVSVNFGGEFNSKIMQVCFFEESYDVWFKYGLAAYRLCVSIYDMKMLAEETAVFVPIAVRWVWR